jgi:hypothetical protein
MFLDGYYQLKLNLDRCISFHAYHYIALPEKGSALTPAVAFAPAQGASWYLHTFRKSFNSSDAAC